MFHFLMQLKNIKLNFLQSLKKMKTAKDYIPSVADIMKIIKSTNNHFIEYYEFVLNFNTKLNGTQILEMIRRSMFLALSLSATEHLLLWFAETI